ncbi:DUF6151 family protein [Photobacterium galatheae]|uniref:CENP-V/GFA domain-containing protein n=1 Tax=Photobacterium galatheae TaxID=1654360 RepID=A0A066RWC2_9GAMM|nr:DUF6151 family protein [Photobacterium galatheae]KDM93416.1 hypothetical protein EA58_00690 [Photobacterium galatheae]MCM0146996.1 hypothetical protein [Photobacterium galatheae]
MATIHLACECGKVQGTAQVPAPSSGNRVVCYCKDCQAFAEQLQPARILTAHRGTAIFQVSPSSVQWTKGAEQIRCLRLTPKGLYRWYAGCCQTPLANTLKPGFPFVGLIETAIVPEDRTEAHLGPIRAHAYPQHADPVLPEEILRTNRVWPMMIRIMLKILGWKLTGKGHPNPFFSRDGQPKVQPEIVNK